jgi:hypothetical protein
VRKVVGPMARFLLAHQRKLPDFMADMVS